METAREAVRRSIEALLDEWTAISMELPDTPARQSLNARMIKLEERLLHWDDLS